MRVIFGDCLFDSGRRGLWRNGDPVRLAPKAFRILEILLERRPNAVAQREIYDELWPDTIVDFANLHNLVSQVRGAIGDLDHSAIRTVYGYGFSFSAKAEAIAEPEEAALSAYALVVGGTAHTLRIGANVVGRSAAADVKILHPSLSRNHTRIVISREGVTVEDLQSRNGTYVNAAPVQGVRAVTTADRLRFGTLDGRIVSDDVVTEDAASLAQWRVTGEG